MARSQLKHLLACVITTGLVCADALADSEPPTPPEFATQPGIDYTSLVNGFSDPPQEARMRAWWFWHNGQATRQSITQDLEAMKAHGIGGVILCDNGSNAPAGPVFMSAGWQELFAHAIRESTRLGVEVSLNIQSGCGDPGNPNIAADNGLKKIVSAEATASGPGKVELRLPMPPASNIFYEDVAVQAFRKNAPKQPSWIWCHSEDWGTAPAEHRYFRRAVEVGTTELRAADLAITADNVCKVWINGRNVTTSDNWKTPVRMSVKKYLEPGRNVMAVEVENLGKGAAGLIAELVLTDHLGAIKRVVTDASWSSSKDGGKSWGSAREDPPGWRPATVIGPSFMDPWKLAFGTSVGAPGRNAQIKNWSVKSFNKNDYNLEKYYDTFPDDGKAGAIDPSGLIDLAAQFRGGVLSWDMPEGNWTVIRYGMTSTGKRNNYASAGYRGGLCYDPINKRGVTAQFNDVARPLIDIANKNGTSLKFLHIDSWEMGLCNWSQGFEEAFRQRRGYDLRPYLPVLAGHIVHSRETSNRFLEDFRMTVGDMAAEENYQLLNRLADAEGVSFHSESAGPHQPPVDGLRTLGATDIPMGEAWARSTTHRAAEPSRMQVALGASAAHIYGKRFLAAEAPTSVGPVWERSPNQVKNVLDRIFCTGVNRVNWHTYDSSPDGFGLPGIAYFAGTHLNRNVTWWEESRTFIDYINRSQHMLTQGLHVADVLGYLGSRAPLFAVLHRLERDDIPAGYAWDMCNADAFLNRASMADGRIVLPDGKSYALFALSADKQMHLPVLRKIEKMVREGMVLVGNPPQRPFGLTGYPESDAEFAAIIARTWGDADGSVPVVKQVDRGRIYVGALVDRVLKAERVRPDLAWEPKEAVDLEYIHHTSMDGRVDVYYVINKWARHGVDDLKYRYIPNVPDRFVSVWCSFRVYDDRVIERWDPVSGKITPVKVYEKADGIYHLPVSLEPEGGAFYVFRKAPSTRHIVRVSRDGMVLNDGNTPLTVGASTVFAREGGLEVLEAGRYEVTFADGNTIGIDHPAAINTLTVQGPWKVDFLERPQLGQPFSATYETLRSWTKSDSHAEKYFSGTARYTKRFTLSQTNHAGGLRTYLDLGYVGDVATVRLNGKGVGIYWKAPYIADITDFTKVGENRLEVDVTNLWVNRLVGDQKLPPEQRMTATNVMSSNWCGRLRKPDADKYLRSSGLVGPVKIRFSRIYDM